MQEKQKGFTLIELLVVISIIGFISSIVLVSMNSARSKARDTKRLADIRQVQTALELYFDTNGSYPLSGNCGGTTIPNSSWCNSVEGLSGGSHWLRNGSNDLSAYFSADPVEPNQVTGVLPGWIPINGTAYFYYSANGGSWYMLVFGLENRNPEVEASDGVTACDGSSSYYHYGSSGNAVITVGQGC